MGKQRESAETVKERILKVSRELFAEYGVKSITIRKIAEEAGINHALVIRYFGSKGAIVNEILSREISFLTATSPPTDRENALDTLVSLRKVLLKILTDQKSTMQLISRAEMDGLHPETLIGQDSKRAADKLSVWLTSQNIGEQAPDPKLLSVVISGAMYSLSVMPSWLMTSVGLAPEDCEKRRQDIVDVMIWILAQATGLSSDAADLMNKR